MTASNQAASEAEEYVTIIAPTLSGVMNQFKARGLAAAGYAITGQAARHHFEVADPAGSHDLFGGSPMVAATFRRSGS